MSLFFPNKEHKVRQIRLGKVTEVVGEIWTIISYLFYILKYNSELSSEIQRALHAYSSAERPQSGCPEHPHSYTATLHICIKGFLTFSSKYLFSLCFVKSVDVLK